MPEFKFGGWGGGNLGWYFICLSSSLFSIFNQLSLVLFVVPPLINYLKWHQFPNLVCCFRNINCQRSLWVSSKNRPLFIIIIIVVPDQCRFSIPWCPNIPNCCSLSVPLCNESTSSPLTRNLIQLEFIFAWKRKNINVNTIFILSSEYMLIQSKWI